MMNHEWFAFLEKISLNWIFPRTNFNEPRIVFGSSKLIWRTNIVLRTFLQERQTICRSSYFVRANQYLFANSYINTQYAMPLGPFYHISDMSALFVARIGSGNNQFDQTERSNYQSRVLWSIWKDIVAVSNTNTAISRGLHQNTIIPWSAKGHSK